MKQLAAAAVTGGALAGLNASMGWDQGSASNWTDKLGRNLSNNVADASIKAALGQGKLEDNLKGAIVGALGASLATQVGDLSTGDAAALNNFGNKVAHALVGCAMGAASTGNSEGCAAGALGAVIAEATAELYNSSGSAKPFTKTLGQITAIVAAAAAGQDVAVAQLAGGNAVENNFLTHTEAAQMRKEFENCDKQPGRCSDAQAKAIADKYKLVSDLNIAQVEWCKFQGDAACVRSLLSQAATVNEVAVKGVGGVTQVFESRANLARMGKVGSGWTDRYSDEQIAEEFKKVREQHCAGLGATACDAKLLEMKGKGQLASLGTFAVGSLPMVVIGGKAYLVAASTSVATGVIESALIEGESYKISDAMYSASLGILVGKGGKMLSVGAQNESSIIRNYIMLKNKTVDYSLGKGVGSLIGNYLGDKDVILFEVPEWRKRLGK